MGIPQYIKDLRPKNLDHATEVRYVGGHYYVYEITSEWDKTRQKAKKKTLHCVGSIKDDKFVPNKYYIENYQNPISEFKIKKYGSFELFLQTGFEIEQQLKSFFPNLYSYIVSLSILSLIYNSSEKSMDYFFNMSYLSILYPKLNFTEEGIYSFLEKLGSEKDSITAYLNCFLENNKGKQNLVFKIREKYINDDFYGEDFYFKKNQLYSFVKESYMPVSYKLLEGFEPSAKSYKKIADDNSIIIGEEGFASDENIAYLEANNLKYILPLCDSSDKIPKDFETEIGFHSFFRYKKGIVYYHIIKENCNKYSLYILKYKGIIRYFVSNINMTADYIFLTYKKREDIEKFFAFVKNNFSYYDNENITDALGFINFIKMQYFYKLMEAFKVSGLKGEYTINDIINHGNDILKILLSNGSESLNEIIDEDLRIFRLMKVKL